MAGTPSISVAGLGKRYQIGELVTVADLPKLTRGTFRRLWRALSLRREDESIDEENEVWALRGVNLVVEPGEVVGVIGRNGAGKSTLLKVLSRVTAPTEGGADIRGRVGSLLEVGTGFHPELTGRENVFLNGAMLGMRRSEIEEAFDAIVSFAGVARFIDTPVKRYSSGMRVRLGFAVAAFLEAEVMLIDEVLAVGDAAFRRQCLGKIDDVMARGRTVLFVSHSMASIRRICSRVVVIEAGEVVFDGGVEEGIDCYNRLLSPGLDSEMTHWFRAHPSPAWSEGDSLVLVDVALDPTLDRSGPRSGNPIELVLTFEAIQPVVRPGFTVDFRAPSDVVAFCASTRFMEEPLTDEAYGRFRVRLVIPRLLLASGTYALDLRAFLGHSPPFREWRNIAGVTVAADAFYPAGPGIQAEHSVAVLEHSWEVEEEQGP